MTRTLHVIALTVLAAVLAVGCTQTTTVASDEQVIRSTIERYNELLIDGYRSLDMNRMREVADQLQSEDEYIHMSSLAEGGVRLDPELRELRFMRVSVEGTSALVETKETWDYRHYSRANGQLVLEQKGLVYHLSWDLARQPGQRWLVTDVRAISSTSTVPPRQIGTITPVPSQNP